MTLSSLITDMTSIFTAEMGWVSTVLSTIAGNPILLVFTVGNKARKRHDRYTPFVIIIINV